MFDLGETGAVTRRQFEEVCNLLKLYPTSLEIELAMFRYDKDLDGKLKIDEFQEALLPGDENYRSLVLRRTPYATQMEHARLQFFLDTTTEKLKKTLQLLMQTEMRCERVRQDLARRKHFDVDKAFKAISLTVNDLPTEDDRASVTKDDISSFLIKFNYAPSMR